MKNFQDYHTAKRKVKVLQIAYKTFQYADLMEFCSLGLLNQVQCVTGFAIFCDSLFIFGALDKVLASSLA